MVKNTTLNPRVFSEIKEFEKSLKRSGFNVLAVYVFGSYAKGKANRNSDVDVAIISHSFGKDRQGERVKLMSLSQKINTAIEPHPFSPDDFDDPYYTLAQEVKKTGVKIQANRHTGIDKGEQL